METDARVEWIVNEALGRSSPAEREGFLRGACGEDAQLRQQVEQRLACQGGVAARVVETVSGADRTVTVKLPPAEETLAEGPGTVIGRYRILEKMGEGGFGAVYVAEQREPVKRRVALKIIKLGMDTRQVVARFEAERQALAMMDHPNIAKVLDAGATETGRPFFVMELVRGIPITAYCDENALSIDQRLGLFIHVCHAVQHAHQKGIIHRDLKPSNILVTLRDRVPVPIVIDFGIAKAMHGELTDKTIYTQFQQFIGTPAYVSPEQAEMSALDIDTEADIYSLGVLLYELLTGRVPFEPKELLEVGVDQMRRILREREPAKPSMRLSKMRAEELTTTAKRRGAAAPKLINELRGDLDSVVMKCLEKDRARRYESAEALASELTRHLANQPVMARPPSTAYRLQKALRRNKVPCAAGAAVVLAVLLIAAAGWWGSHYRGSFPSQRGTRRITSLAVKPIDDFSGDTNQAYLSDGMTEALCAALGNISALRVPGRSSVMRFKGTQNAIQTMAKELNVDVIVEGSIQRASNRILITVQLIDASADRHLWATNFGGDIGEFFKLQGEVARSIAQEVQVRLTPEDQEQLSRARAANGDAVEAYLLGLHHWWKWSDEGLTNALRYFQKAVEIDPTFAAAYVGTAFDYGFQAEWSLLPSREALGKAKEAAQRAIELDPMLAEGYAARGYVHTALDWDWGGADLDYERALELKPRSPLALDLYNNFLTMRGRYDEGIAVLNRALQVDPLSPALHADLAYTLMCCRRFDEAILHCEKALELDRNFEWAHWTLGISYLCLGRTNEGLATCETLVRISPDTPSSIACLGYAYGVTGRHGEARRVLRDLEELARKRYVSSFPFATIHIGLGGTREALDRLEVASDEHNPNMAYLKCDPLLSKLKSELRYQALLKKMGLDR